MAPDGPLGGTTGRASAVFRLFARDDVLPHASGHAGSDWERDGPEGTARSVELPTGAAGRDLSQVVHSVSVNVLAEAQPHPVD